MKEMTLTNSSRVIQVSDEDYERVKWHSKWIVVSSNTGETINSTKRPHQSLATFILNTASLVDHKDGNFLNNQRDNLRLCTHSQNMMNRSKCDRLSGTSSKHKGVCWNKQRKEWHVRIAINKRRIHIGFFKSENEAALAYNNYAVKYHGEFARLNEIKTDYGGVLSL